MFANSRMARLKGLIQKDKNSITAKKGTKKSGTPLGINKSKNVLSLFKKPIKTIAIKKLKESDKVSIICPVIDIL